MTPIFTAGKGFYRKGREGRKAASISGERSGYVIKFKHDKGKY
jgi:hypothetical protein